MGEPFINHGKDTLTCRYCGESVLPGETHVCYPKLARNDKICPYCGHLCVYHDGAGCTVMVLGGYVCPCNAAIDMPGDDQHFLPVAELQAKLILEEQQKGDNQDGDRAR